MNTNKTQGEVLDEILQNIADGKHPGTYLEDTKELADWLVKNSLVRFAGFMFIAEVVFTRFPNLMASINRKVMLKYLGDALLESETSEEFHQKLKDTN